jgi:2,3-bisphosphoglycerate-independent phosphoglycerate mutase
MIDASGLPHTSHTLNPVRIILAGEKYKDKELRNGILGDIAPTILEVMDIIKPEDMAGKSLLK